jgi:hypothetical protein
MWLRLSTATTISELMPNSGLRSYVSPWPPPTLLGQERIGVVEPLVIAISSPRLRLLHFMVIFLPLRWSFIQTTSDSVSVTLLHIMTRTYCAVFHSLDWQYSCVGTLQNKAALSDN